MFTAGKQRTSEENSLYSLHLHQDGPRMLLTPFRNSTLSLSSRMKTAAPRQTTQPVKHQ